VIRELKSKPKQAREGLKLVKPQTSNHGLKMFLENGTKLAERLVPRSLSNAATALVEALNLNSITEKRRRGRPVLVKRRNLAGEPLANLANAYFRKSRIPIHFLSDVKEWRRREMTSFNMLNGDRFRARASGAGTIIEDKLPGESLWDHMKRGTLSQRMLQAVAREIHRAHQFWSDDFDGPWSHADATTTNAIYDEKTRRVRLIDFEIEHDKSLPARARHADDLLVFLLDMVGSVSSRQWLPFALCFLNAYNEADVIAELRKRLLLPGGLAWVWWEVRTNFTAPAKVKRRLASLRAAIAKLEIYRAAAVRARHKRRPSIICHAIKPGTPTASSRTLAIKERAKAASPGKPRRLPTTR
jgi:hypothetical protein